MITIRLIKYTIIYWAWELGIRKYCWQCDKCLWWTHKHPHNYIVLEGG